MLTKFKCFHFKYLEFTEFKVFENNTSPKHFIYKSYQFLFVSSMIKIGDKSFTFLNQKFYNPDFLDASLNLEYEGRIAELSQRAS